MISSPKNGLGSRVDSSLKSDFISEGNNIKEKLHAAPAEQSDRMSTFARDFSPHPSQYPLGELLQYEVSQEGDTHLSRNELKKSADSSLNVIKE